MNNWNNNKFLKWALVFAFLAFALFTFLKDRGYCDELECEYVDPAKEFNYEFPSSPVPVEDEYLFQYTPPHYACKSLKIESYECRGNYTIREEYRPKPNRNQRALWQEEYDNHHFNAVRTYNDAYNRIWFLPNLTMRQVGRDAWVAACAMAGTQTPCQALAIGLATMVSQYGLHCLDEYDYIQDKLKWSQYHFEQCVYYAGLLNG